MTREISPELLRELIDYDPNTGSLIWKPRDPKYFCGKQQSPAHSAKIWNAKYAGKPALASVDGRGYLHGAVFGRTISAHQAAWAIHYGKWPEHGIDHIFGDTTDHRISMLRDVPDADNAKNQKRRSDNTSGVTGVSYFARTGRWVAMIKGEGKARQLGYYRTLEEAAAARKAAEAKYGFHPNHGRVAA